MKKIFLSLSVILFATTLIVTSCSSPADKVDAAKDNLQAAEDNLTNVRKDSIAAHERTKAEFNSQITENQELIADYKARIAKQKKEVRAEYEESLDKLEQKNDDMKVMVAKYDTGTLDGWDQFKLSFYLAKDNFKDDMAALGKKITALGQSK